MRKVRIFNFSYKVPFPAEKVWALIADDYGNVADYADGLVSSHSLDGPGGCERRCDMDNKGKSYLIEKKVDVDVDNMTFTNLITEAKNLPIVPLLSKTIFSLKRINNDSCELSIEVHFRTKPAFLSMLMKGMSKKQMDNLVIGMQHLLKTGEKVNRDNFKFIRKQYVLAS